MLSPVGTLDRLHWRFCEEWVVGDGIGVQFQVSWGQDIGWETGRKHGTVAVAVAVIYALFVLVYVPSQPRGSDKIS